MTTTLVTVSLPEFAERLGVSYWTARRWWKQGALPVPLDLPGQVRWLDSVVERFIAERAAQPRRYFAAARKLA